MVRFFLLMLAGVCLGLFGVASAEDKDTKGDAGKLKGSYEIVKGQRNGKAIPEEEIKGSVVIFAEGKVVGTDKDKKELFAATFTLDTGSKPWKISMTGTSPKKGEKAEGVVEVDGDTLRICYNLPGGAAPKDFKAGEKQQCFTLKRMKTK